MINAIEANTIETELVPIRAVLVMAKFVPAGTRAVLMNYWRFVDLRKIHFDLIVDEDSPLKDYSEIEALGGCVYEVPSVRHPIKNLLAYLRIFKQGNYDCVHGYMNTLNIFPMFAAKLAGVPVRVAENLSAGHPSEKKTFIKNILKVFSRCFPNYLAANSEYAAKWMYGATKIEKVQIIRNGLDLEKIKYDPNLRSKTRKTLNLESSFVLGNISRYSYQKNHKFLIEIFNAVYQKDSTARLMLIGYGELKETVFEQIKALGLMDVVIDIGATEDILPYYNAMDCFVLPSFYEGLPVVGVEAQAVGLPCVMSDEVTVETAVTDYAKFIALDQSPEYWANEILRFKHYTRNDVRQSIKESGYDIREEAVILEDFYIRAVQEQSVKRNYRIFQRN